MTAFARTKVLAPGEGLRLQSGPGRDLVFKVTGEDTGGAFDYFIVEVSPKGGPPLHVHHGQEETIHVLKGQYKIQIGDETFRLAEGGFAYLPTGARAVVSTVTVIARLFAGEKGASFHDVDLVGHRHLIAAAEGADVGRFLFVSALSSRFDESATTPLGKGKVATEQALSASPLREVILRPDLFQEIWLSAAAQFDWLNRKVVIFGKGETPSRYVATDDVAEAASKLVLADDPPRLVEFGGPEALTRKQAVTVFERALGEPIRVRHVPRTALRIGSVALRRFQPAMASVMGGALALDLHPATCTDEPLCQLGIAPRSVKTYAVGIFYGAVGILAYYLWR